MFDPFDALNFEDTDYGLQQFAMFAVLVAGKSALTTKANLSKLLDWVDLNLGKGLPLTLIHNHFVMSGKSNLGAFQGLLKSLGFGCYNLKAQSLLDLANKVINGLDLRTCSVDDLEAVIGIGPKTSRFFLMFSRKGLNDIAILDTHILQHMKQLGYDVPKSTPTGQKYKQIEKLFVDHVKQSGKTMAEYDFEQWKQSARGGK